MPSPMIGSGGAAEGGPAVENMAPTEQALQDAPPVQQPISASADSEEDVDLAERRLLSEPWFAKLPPELRSAIRNNSRRRPPRGYEERLKEYFENID